MKVQLPYILAILLVLSAIGLINSQYQVRKVFAMVEAAQVQTRQLEIEKNQLQVKQSALSEHASIEKKAVSDLDMIRITKSNTEYLRVE